MVVVQEPKEEHCGYALVAITERVVLNNRLSYIDQAILLVGTSEYNLNKDNKKIIIDEAVRIAKEYSDDDSYKYINGVLDNL